MTCLAEETKDNLLAHKDLLRQQDSNRLKNFYSKKQCNEYFLLSDNDLKNTDFFYGENMIKLYNYKDVRTLIIQKHGSYDKFINHFTDNRTRRENIKKKEIKAQKERRKQIIAAFYDNKLEFKNYGDCYSFIHYGKPDINTILEKEQYNQGDKMDRTISLANELSKLNIKFDERLQSCNNYIHKIGNCELNDIIEEAKKEDYLKRETNYISYLQKNPYKKAKQKAIQELMDNKCINDTPFFDEFVISFD
jgi:hypothetical protein